MKNILFVCTGNTCRSFMAEAIFKDMMKDEDVSIFSRGVSAAENMNASKNAIRVLEDMGIDPDNHRSKLLRSSDVDRADIILTMTNNHKALVLNLYPSAEAKIYTLKEYANRDVDINGILDKINDVYEEINEKRDRLMEERQDEVSKLHDRKIELLEEIEEINQKLKGWQDDIEDNLKEDKKRIIKLQDRIPKIDIEDPFGGDTSDYKKSAEEIKKALEKIKKEFKNEGE